MKDNSNDFGLSNSDTIKELEELKKELESTKKKYLIDMHEIQKMSAKYNEMIQKENPYRAALDELQKQQEEMSVNIGSYENLYQKRLATDKWYLKEYEKVIKAKNKMSEDEQTQILFDLNNLYSEKKSQNNQELYKKYSNELGDIVGDGLSDILTDYKNFDATLKSMTKELFKYLISQATDWLKTKAVNSGWFDKLGSILGSLGSAGGSAMSSGMGFVKRKTVWDTIKEFFGIGMKFHDGGIVPVGANTELPGTKEQLAILKGGERILSPGENAGYKSSRQSSSPVIFNNFNVKAWDSKDVRRYLIENKELLNQITFEGIKNNNAHLRNIVRSA